MIALAQGLQTKNNSGEPVISRDEFNEDSIGSKDNPAES